jgi:bacillopeptidase F (M6 metalloprotease family)
MEIRKIRTVLFPYLKDAKKRGHRAFLKKDKLKVNGRIYDTEHLKENIQTVKKDQGVDTPVVKRSPVSEQMSQQNTGNKTAPDYRRGGARG